MPCVAPCCHRELTIALLAVPRPNSHEKKPKVTMGARLLSTVYEIADMTPASVLLSATTNSRLAPGAAAPANSRPTVPVLELPPGSLPTSFVVMALAGNPKLDR
jgi:hypothetical protein